MLCGERSSVWWSLRRRLMHEAVWMVRVGDGQAAAGAGWS